MKILIVDDSQAMRNIITWNLRHAEISVQKIFEASCYEDAIRIIESRNPNLVISDWNMPNMEGLKLLKSLRSVNNKIKFGFMITQASINMRKLALDAGADFIISDPSSIEALKNQVCTPM